MRWTNQEIWTSVGSYQKLLMCESNIVGLLKALLMAPHTAKSRHRQEHLCCYFILGRFGLMGQNDDLYYNKVL